MVSLEDAAVPGLPVEACECEGRCWLFGFVNELDRFVTLVVGECAREVAELGEIVAWNGDQNVVEESMVCTGEEAPK
jgi:hypothetical protein